MGAGSGLRSAVERAWWNPRWSLAALALSPLALLYGVALALRRAAYATGLRRPWRAPVPVIVVGNLIVGGAGKTPTVIALVDALRRQGWTPGVISRGHGARLSTARAVHAGSTAADVGDEPLLLHRRTGVPVWVGHDRRAVAASLCAAHPRVDLLIADDGLQHLALARDAQLVVFDARGFGNGLLLPAGPLRERRWRRLPPRTLVIYNGCEASTPLPGEVAAAALGEVWPLAAWWAGDRSAALPLDRLRGRRVRAAAGIGHPERFFTMLERRGLSVERWPLPDHAPLEPRPWPRDGARVVVTEKDAVKLPPDAPDAADILVATLDSSLPPAAVERLVSWLPSPSRRPPPAF